MAVSNDKYIFRLPKWIYVYWKILGLCPFGIGKKDSIVSTRSGLLYNTSLILFYLFLYVTICVRSLHSKAPNDTGVIVAIHFLGSSAECFFAISTWLHVALRQNEFKRIYEKCKIIEAYFLVIGLDKNVKKVFRKLKILLLFINVVWFVFYCGDFLIIYRYSEIYTDIWMPLIIPRAGSVNVMFMFVAALIIIGKLFHRLNDKIYDLSDESASTLRFPRNLRKSCKYTRLHSYVPLAPLEIYGQMHSDLVTFVKMVAKFWALPILLRLLNHVIIAAAQTYVLLHLMRDNVLHRLEQQLEFVLTWTWLFYHVGIIIAIVTIADTTTNEANRTGQILHQALVLENNRKHVDTGKLFSLRLLHSRLTISLWGMLRMKSSIMPTVAGMICTYITIMVQFDDSENLQRLKTSPESIVNPTNTLNGY